jgi:hypothetical protein
MSLFQSHSKAPELPAEADLHGRMTILSHSQADRNHKVQDRGNGGHHKFAFDKESRILATLFSFPGVDAAAVAADVRPLFERQDPEEIESLVGQLMAQASNKEEFRRLLRDFLVAVRHFSLLDPELNQEENQRRRPAWQSTSPVCMRMIDSCSIINCEEGTLHSVFLGQG